MPSCPNKVLNAVDKQLTFILLSDSECFWVFLTETSASRNNIITRRTHLCFDGRRRSFFQSGRARDFFVGQTFRLLHEDGFFVGASSGLNVAAAVQVAKLLGPGHTIVTALCDGGMVSGHRQP